MKKWSIFLLVASLLFGTANVNAQTDKTVIYVSPAGNDSADGTVENPLQSVNAARLAARKYLKNGISVEVVFRGGEYRMTEGVSFTAEDSGTKENPVVYRAYDGEKVTFKGSKTLDTSTVSQITDKGILNRIHSNATGKVLEIDLAANGITSDMLFNAETTTLNTNAKIKGGEPNSLYINDKELEIAHWPNGRNYSNFTIGDNNYSMYYSESDPDRWGKAKGWWVEGYVDTDYRKLRISVDNIDTSKRLITLYEKPVLKVSSYFSRRWQAWNLLEEIDLPGEYYIDCNTMKLYFYPPYTLKNADMELSVLKDNMFTITDAHDITFTGFEFTQTRNDVFNMANVDNIDIIGNTFTNISATAVWCYGESHQTTYKAAKTDAGYWQKQILDCSYNCDIKDNVFYMIGGAAVNISGGNVDTLTPSNNIIENNLILRTSQKYFQNGQAAELYGCGNIVRKNEFGGVPHQGIFMLGNDHVIEYNEFYDICQETSDSGVIYRGQGLNGRGIRASYNYIHDCNNTTELPHPWQNAIYWDGGQEGCMADHNIIYNMPSSLLANSVGYQIHQYNVAVDCSYHPLRITRKGDTLPTVTMDTKFSGRTLRDFYNDLPNKDIYFEKYPELKAYYDGIPSITFAEIDENLVVGGGDDEIGGAAEKFGKSWTKNIRTDDKSIFVDPENQDFRLKNDSETAKEMPHLLNENFNLDEIGYQNDVKFDGETSPFRLLYPANGQAGISDYKVQFKWEQAMGAMTYRLVIAKDPELTDVVYDKTTGYYSVTVDELEADTRYYWKVYAQSRGRKHVNTWESDGAVYTFTTNLYETLDTADAQAVIASAETLIPKIREGDAVGEYAVGTADTLKTMAERINTLLQLPAGAVKRNQLQKQVAALNNKIQNGAMNTGFVNLADYFKPEYWDERVPGKLHISDGELLLEHDFQFESRERLEGENIVGTNCLGDLAGSVVFCFDAELHLGTEEAHGWADMVTYGQNLETTQIQWSAPNLGYYNCGGAWGTGVMRSDGATYTGLNSTSGIQKYDEKQTIKFGMIRTSIGSYIVFEVDGDDTMSVADVETVITAPLEFVMANRATGGKIKLTETENMPTQDEADELWRKAKYMLVEAIIKRYGEFCENTVVMKRGGTKIVTENGVIDITDNPAEYIGGRITVPFDALAKAFDMTAQHSGNEIILKKADTEIKFTVDSTACTVNGTPYTLPVAPTEKDGTVMVPVEDVRQMLGMQMSYYDDKTGLYMIAENGNFPFQDQPVTLARSSAMFDEMSDMNDKTDVKFNDFKNKK